MLLRDSICRYQDSGPWPKPFQIPPPLPPQKKKRKIINVKYVSHPYIVHTLMIFKSSPNWEPLTQSSALRLIWRTNWFPWSEISKAHFSGTKDISKSSENDAFFAGPSWWPGFFEYPPAIVFTPKHVSLKKTETGSHNTPMEEMPTVLNKLVPSEKIVE